VFIRSLDEANRAMPSPCGTGVSFALWILGEPEVEPLRPTPTELDSSSGLLPTNPPLFPGGLQLLEWENAFSISN